MHWEVHLPCCPGVLQESASLIPLNEADLGKLEAKGQEAGGDL